MQPFKLLAAFQHTIGHLAPAGRVTILFLSDFSICISGPPTSVCV